MDALPVAKDPTFTYTHSKPYQKLTPSSVTCIEMNVICDVRMALAVALEQAFSKPSNPSYFARHYSNTKNEVFFEAFFQSFQVTK